MKGLIGIKSMNDIDNSRLDCFKNCHQLYDFLYNHEVGGLEPKWKADYSTWMIHTPVQEWYALGGKYEPNWGLLMKAWGPTPEDMLNDKYGNYTAQRAERLFKEFREKAIARGDLEEYEYIEHEVYKTRDMGAENFLWGSKTDLVLRQRSTGDIHIGEIKASKWDYILTGIQFNRQVLGEIYVNNATKGIIIFFNLAAKKNEDGVMFIEVEPSDEEMDRWKQRVNMEIKPLEHCYEVDFWPPNEHYCRRYNTVCEFLDLCDQGGTASSEIRAKVNDMPKRDSLSYLTKSNDT